MYLLNDPFMSKVERVESELRKLSQAELRQIREWLDDIIEDELEFTPEFEHSIQQAERDMANGKSARVVSLALCERSDSDLHLTGIVVRRTEFTDDEKWTLQR